MSERLFDDKVFDATWNMIGPDGHCIPWWDIAKNEIKDFIDAEIRRNTAKLEAELAEAKERIKTTAKNGIACVIASEDKLAAQSALISRMREVLEEAKGCLATLLWDAMKHDAVSKSLEKYEGIGKRITDVLARCETEVPSSNG